MNLEHLEEMHRNKISVTGLLQNKLEHLNQETMFHVRSKMCSHGVHKSSEKI